MSLGIYTILLLICSCYLASGIRYEPTWESLDTRPNPPWFDEVKFGIMMHWGVFSVPSYKHEWFWWLWKSGKNAAFIDFMKNNYRPNFSYQDFAKDLTAEFYDPNQWAEIFAASGAKYTAIVAKHHEGFAMWPSKYDYQWNSMAVGPKRDLIGEFATAIRKTDVRFGIYYSLYEWYNELYQLDLDNGYTTQYYVKEKMQPQLHELIETYKPDLLWSDGDWMAPSSYFNSTNFVAWLYNDSPVKDTIVTNDRYGRDVRCVHGGYLNCGDQYNPMRLQKRKWEDVLLISKNCAVFRREATLGMVHNIEELLVKLVQAISYGGNMILNIGITKEGKIPVLFEERLRQMGSWLKVNGEAVYGSKVWTHQADSATGGIWYTAKGSSVYAFLFAWPGEGLHLGSVEPKATTKITLLGAPQLNITWTKSPKGGIDIVVPPLHYSDMPCYWAWVLKFQGL